MRNVASVQSLYGPSAQPIFGQPTATVQDARATTVAAPPAGAPIPVTALFAGIRNSFLGQPVLWLFALIGLLVLYKVIEEKRGTASEFQELKIGLSNVTKIGLSAVVFIVVMKFLFTRYDVPGLSAIFKAA